MLLGEANLEARLRRSFALPAPGPCVNLHLILTPMGCSLTA
jgi:hypothetical protein